MSPVAIHADACAFSGYVLDSFAGRARGWLGRTPSSLLQALVLTPCRGVHFLGMCVPLHVLLVAPGGAVVAAVFARPGSAPVWHPEAAAVVEIAAAFVPPGFAPERVTWRP